MPQPVQVNRRAMSVMFPAELLVQASNLGVDISKICEQGLKAEIARIEADRWLEENREALASSNDYVERNGVPLSEFRHF